MSAGCALTREVQHRQQLLLQELLQIRLLGGDAVAADEPYPEHLHTFSEAMVSVALLPLLRQQQDIVDLVLQHWKWALLLDKLSHLEQRFISCWSAAAARMGALRHVELAIWNRVGAGESFSDPGNGSLRRQARSVAQDIIAHCASVLAGLRQLRHDAESIKKITHPDPSRDARKREVQKVRKKLQSLLAGIDKLLAGWTQNQRIVQEDVRWL